MNIRLCEQKDEDNWIAMNREFMSFIIQDGSTWGGTEKTPDSVFKNTFRTAMQSPSLITLFIIEEDGVPIGFVNLMTTFSIWSHGKMLVLDDIYLKEEFRRKGYGKTIMQFVENYAKENDFKRLQFQSTPTNPEAKSFYNALGFDANDMYYYAKHF